MPKIQSPKPKISKQHVRTAARIYRVAQTIPRGKVATYKHVAGKARMPKAARYVGSVLGKNRNPRVPCHRVVRADGKVGGFRDGTREKIRLLRREGITIRGNCVAAERVIQ